jgi:plasmid stability protein
MDEPKRITINVPQDLHRQARIEAARSGRSLSDILREMIDAWLQEQARKRGEKELAK